MTYFEIGLPGIYAVYCESLQRAAKASCHLHIFGFLLSRMVNQSRSSFSCPICFSMMMILTKERVAADIQTIHFETLVLGDLSKHEAFKYYLEVIKRIREDRQQLFSRDEKSFDEIFHLTGGRMVLIEQYVSEVSRTGIRKTGTFTLNLCGKPA